MPSTTIRIDERILAVVRELARQQHQTMQTILSEAIESYRRRKFLEQANAGFATLRRDPAAWAEEQEERDLWDRTVKDGLERE
jgi:predicted transcriptional regulator